MTPQLWLLMGGMVAILWLSKIVQSARMLGSYKMVLDLIGMLSNLRGKDRNDLDIDEASTKRLFLGIALLLVAGGPISIFVLIMSLRDL